MSILEELFNGNINPSTKYIKNGGKYQKLNAQLTEYIDELMALLSDKEKELCEKIGSKSCELSYMSEKEYFIEGFCIGAQMAWEIMNFRNENYIE